ncbi:protein PRRC2A [Bombina bombina]|uniref:protein PRRC2A n=1 Tax=Bombina bombina TaxID=8345 RepID=UPI00235A902C|nr:protein PRRC2A [Bombina bombina]
MSQSDSGVDLSSDSQLSSSSCSQRSSPDGGLKPEGDKRAGRAAGQQQHGQKLLVVPPPGPIGTERSQKPEGSRGSNAPSCLPSASHSTNPKIGSSSRPWDLSTQSTSSETPVDPRQFAPSPSLPEGTRQQPQDDRNQRLYSSQFLPGMKTLCK